ncbi:MAG: hypothetical protein M0C28_22655 [Candidatus Moduliflexus flocculans]|nr:hypothetical protein [Candidatus Moduliflexus flocculans]
MLASTIGGGITIGTVANAYRIGFPAFWFVAAGGIAHFLQGALLSERVRASEALTLPDLANRYLGPAVRMEISLDHPRNLDRNLGGAVCRRGPHHHHPDGHAPPGCGGRSGRLHRGLYPDRRSEVGAPHGPVPVRGPGGSRRAGPGVPVPGQTARPGGHPDRPVQRKISGPWTWSTTWS